MPTKSIDFQGLLAELIDAEVDFIVVGGVAAGFHGLIIATGDLDLVYSRDSQNLERLERVLLRIDGCYRMKPEVKPLASRFDGPGHHNLSTRYGKLDLLGSIVGGEGYKELIDRTEVVPLSAGRAVRVLDLPSLIRVKEQLTDEKDKYHLTLLKRLLVERMPK